MADASPSSAKRDWTALLLAGSRPGGDPFATANGVPIKPLIPVAGEPMVRRVARSLLASPLVRAVRILTQHAAAIRPAVPADDRLSIEPSGPTIAATIAAILADPATAYPLLVTTADHALLDPAMIAEFCRAAEHADLAIAVVERRALNAAIPRTKRTWIGFRGGAYSGANLFALGSPAAATAVGLWRDVEQDRKKGWRMLLAFGPLLLIGAGLRLRSIGQSGAAVGRRLGIDLRIVTMSNPLACIDVDKPADLVLVEAILSARA